jgi:hypothetical protein
MQWVQRRWWWQRWLDRRRMLQQQAVDDAAFYTVAYKNQDWVRGDTKWIVQVVLLENALGERQVVTSGGLYQEDEKRSKADSLAWCYGGPIPSNYHIVRQPFTAILPEELES